MEDSLSTENCGKHNLLNSHAAVFHSIENCVNDKAAPFIMIGRVAMSQSSLWLLEITIIVSIF